MRRWCCSGWHGPNWADLRPPPAGTVVIELEPLSTGECGELLDDLGVSDPRFGAASSRRPTATRSSSSSSRR